MQQLMAFVEKQLPGSFTHLAENVIISNPSV